MRRRPTLKSRFVAFFALLTLALRAAPGHAAAAPADSAKAPPPVLSLIHI